MFGKRYSDTLFGGVPAIVGNTVFVTTSEGGLLAGHIHHIIEEPWRGLRAEGAPGPAPIEHVFVTYVSFGGWDDPPAVKVAELPFFDPRTREEADAMPPEHWCWPRTWQEAEVTACPCGNGKAFADCHGANQEAT